MKIIKSRPWIVVVTFAVIAGALVAGWRIRQALAEGVPSTDPLYVGGMLTDGVVPVEGVRDVTVRLYAADSGGSAVCTTSAPGASVSGGRFRIALDASCATAVHADPNLWMEVQVDTTTFPGRMKVGAVPYALESGRASEAAGALAAELADLRSRVTDLETGPGRTCSTGMVPVGDFCIDKYEASVWQNDDCTGTQYGTASDNYDSVGFRNNGNWSSPLYACSVPLVVPARYLTWFQAAQACALAGKHLCTNEEWQTAAAGTNDNGAWPGTEGTCLATTSAGGRCLTCASGYRVTGGAGRAGEANSCISGYGAEDMIGNLWEWVAYWSTEPGSNGSVATWNDVSSATYFGDSYSHGGPATSPAWGASGSYMVLDGSGEQRLPAAALRGGAWNGATEAGAFSVHLGFCPSYYSEYVGFRCCLGR